MPVILTEDEIINALEEGCLARKLDKGMLEIDEAIDILMKYTLAYQYHPGERMITHIDRVVFENRNGEIWARKEHEEQEVDIQACQREEIRSLFRSYYPDLEAISPYDFVAWAIERDTIQVGRPLVNWKRRKDIARQFPQEGERAQWQAILPELDAQKRAAARAAICKLKSMSHAETYWHIFEESRSNENGKSALPASAINRISGLRKLAQSIADEYGLQMPVWDIRDKNMIKT